MTRERPVELTFQTPPAPGQSPQDIRFDKEDQILDQMIDRIYNTDLLGSFFTMFPVNERAIQLVRADLREFLRNLEQQELDLLERGR